ncbi:MAG: IclR family transcriptional regulator C-terminal domain-containing protein [Chitinophagaceae bacterium]
MIQVIVRALDILEFIAQHGKEPVQLIKIAENAGLSQPTTANIVKTLVSKNYLEHVGRRTGYRLGANAFHLTGNLSYNQNLILAAKDFMEDLTHQLNETCLIGVLRNNKRFILHAVHSDQDLQVRTRTEADVYPTASGRLLTAYLTQKELDNLVQSIGLPPASVWPGAQTREGLEKALQKIRKQEFVQTLNDKHIMGFAVPVYKNKQVISSLSVFLPESRATTAYRENILKLMLRTANKIKERLNKADV